MIYVIAVCTKKRYREKFVTERELQGFKNKLKNKKINDLIVIGVQTAILGFDRN